VCSSGHNKVEIVVLWRGMQAACQCERRAAKRTEC
jgi:hypothetical protein